MKKTIVKKDGDILQITTVDERWYVKEVDKVNIFVPSVTWITGFYPKGVEFYKWLASKGWDESIAIRDAAGSRGSKVHYAVDDLIKGNEVKMTDKYFNPKTEQPEELEVDEYQCLMSFVAWCEEYNPEFIFSEVTFFTDKFAGTIDCICKIKNKKTGLDEFYLVDWKTSKSIWPSMQLQLSAYKKGALNIPEINSKVDMSNIKLAILQLGYTRNKKGFKFTEIEDNYKLFEASYEIWKSECENIVPLQKDYPTSLKLSLTIEQK